MEIIGNFPKSQNMSGFKEELVGAVALKSERGLRRKAGIKEDLEVYQGLDEGVRLKVYLHEQFRRRHTVHSQV